MCSYNAQTNIFVFNINHICIGSPSQAKFSYSEYNEIYRANVVANPNQSNYYCFKIIIMAFRLLMK